MEDSKVIRVIIFNPFLHASSKKALNLQKENE
jgi:hypothetical protein